MTPAAGGLARRPPRASRGRRRARARRPAAPPRSPRTRRRRARICARSSRSRNGVGEHALVDDARATAPAALPRSRPTPRRTASTPSAVLGAPERRVARQRDDEVRPQQPEVEADRPVEAELAVERARRAVPRTITLPVWRSPWISASPRVMNACLAAAAAARISGVCNDARHRLDLVLEPVALGARERLGQDEILGDLAQLGRDRLGGEQLERLRLDARAARCGTRRRPT